MSYQEKNAVSLALIEGFGQSARRLASFEQYSRIRVWVLGFVSLFISLLIWWKDPIFHHVWFPISPTKHLAKGDFRKGVSAVNSKEHNNDKIFLCVSKWLDISRSQVRKVWWLLREIVLEIPQGLACYAFHRSITEIVLIRCSNYYPPKTVVLMGWEEASLSFAAYLLSLGHLLHYPPQEQRYLPLSLFFFIVPRTNTSLLIESLFIPVGRVTF